MSLEIHPSSTQYLYFPVLAEVPSTGATDLSAIGVEIAMPAVGAAASTWVTAAWDGTKRIGDRRYHVARVATSGFTLTNSTTYQPWIRLGGSGGAIVKVDGTVKITNT